MKREDYYPRLVYDYWRRHLRRYVRLQSDTVILECGTGPGNLSRLITGWFPQVKYIGLDIDAKAVREAKGRAPRVSFVLGSAEQLPFTEASLDAIVSLHMVEHLELVEKFFQEAHRTIRPNGVLILATHNPHGIGARVMGTQWTGWIPEHISLLPPDKWRRLLDNYGFVILRDGTTGISGIPIFRKLPLALLNWGPLFLFGFFPWSQGEAYICIARKDG
jgi:ubiquinone/menaquinone biosynthesis C-methylase UbiE